MKIKIKKLKDTSGHSISCKKINGMIYCGNHHIEISKKKATDYHVCLTKEFGIMVYDKNTKDVKTIRL
jgi:hypothetical protein